MLRKICVTGLIIFVVPGSLLQIIVALVSSLIFGFASAWYQPFQNNAANVFKVATELTLVCTLTFATMLRFDLTKEDIGPQTLGVLLTMTNFIGPGTGLLFGLQLHGLQFDRELEEVEDTIEKTVSTEFQNPALKELSDDADADEPIQAT
eukprot:SAG31_NODE_3969_length_3708_cov_2.601829_2_plen_150_part_00